MTIPSNKHGLNYGANLNEAVSPKNQGLLQSLISGYFILHLVVSFTGAYNFVPTFYYGPTIPDYLALLLLVLGITINRKSWNLLSSLFPYGLMIIIYYSIALASSPYVGALLKIGCSNIMILLILTFAVPLAISDELSLHRFARAVQIAALVVLAVIVAESTNPRFAEFLSIQKKLDIWSIAEHVFRPGGLFRNANDVASFFVFTFLLSYWCPGTLRLVGRVASVFGTYFSASRGGAFIMALCIVLFTINALRYRTEGDRLRILRLGSAMLVTVLITFALYRVIGSQNLAVKSDTGVSRTERILSITDSTGTAGRFALWSYWIPIALSAPLNGEGLYSFQGGLYSPASRHVYNQGTHNMWIMLLGEIGPVGPLCYFVIVVLALVRVLRLRGHPRDRFVLLLMWGVYVFLSLKGHNQLEHRHFIVAMALILYLPRFLAFVENIPQRGRELILNSDGYASTK